MFVEIQVQTGATHRFAGPCTVDDAEQTATPLDRNDRRLSAEAVNCLTYSSTKPQADVIRLAT